MLVISQHTSDQWFEDIEVEGQKLSHVSKFWRTDFAVSLREVENFWPLWSPEDRDSFALPFPNDESLTMKMRNCLPT